MSLCLLVVLFYLFVFFFPIYLLLSLHYVLFYSVFIEIPLINIKLTVVKCNVPTRNLLIKFRCGAAHALVLFFILSNKLLIHFKVSHLCNFIFVYLFLFDKYLYRVFYTSVHLPVKICLCFKKMYK